MSTININHYVQLDKDNPERTRARLQQIVDMGMVEIGIACFGVQHVMSGLYIEKVWNLSDEEWNEYMKWVRDLVIEHINHWEEEKKKCEQSITYFLTTYMKIKLPDGRVVPFTASPQAFEIAELIVKAQREGKTLKLQKYRTGSVFVEIK